MARAKPRLTHVDEAGAVRMVDVGAKAVTAREAVARGRISMSREARSLIAAGAVKKGDPLQAARLAGIMAAKRTSDIVPLCHPLPLTHVEVSLRPRTNGYDIEARVRTIARTGVEMEALTAVSAAALTVYDMLKAVDRTMVIGDIRLIEKRGGRSGEYPGVNVLVLIHSPFAIWNIPDAHVERLRRRFPQHVFLHARDDEEAARLIGDADVAFSSQIGPELLARAPRLRWIHSPAAGVGSMLFPAMLARDVVISNSRGMAADTIAEHVLAVVLALFRRLPLAIRRQGERRWAQDEIGAPPGNRTIAGSRALVVGLGAIGTAVAARMAALGAEVAAIRRDPGRGSAPGVLRVSPPEALESELRTAQIVVLCAPDTRETRKMIGAGELKAMRPDAVLVNVSRGKLVDEEALAAALETGTIAGAALDVFAHEPLDLASPLWDLPTVLITPHTSGFRPDHWDAATDLFETNLRRFEAGEPLLNVVDKGAGY